MTDENFQQNPAGEQKKLSDLLDELQAEATALLQLHSTASSEHDEAPERIETEIILQPGIGVSEFARHVHLYVQEYIRLADQKAAFIFLFVSALLAFLYNKDLHVGWLRHPQHWSALDLCALLSMVSLFIALTFAVLVVMPRLAKSHVGYVFFKSVNEFESASKYATSISRENDKQLAMSILKHTYDISRVCSKKYVFFSVAFWTSVIGVLLTVITLLFKQP